MAVDLCGDMECTETSCASAKPWRRFSEPVIAFGRWHDGQGDVTKTHLGWMAEDGIPDVTTP
ncbi:hypothetical protein LBMAG57_38590 [Verrucomicrobiota bacterium]|nr:hypothetical protein LBMAG57_38590 [Verrucomicrobiota bacterium]